MSSQQFILTKHISQKNNIASIMWPKDTSFNILTKTDILWHK